MDISLIIKLIPLFPLLGFIFCGTIAGRFSRLVTGAIATACVFISFLLGLRVFFHLLAQPENHRSIQATLYSWIAIGGAKPLDLDVTFLADPLSITMTLVITGIGGLIHLYAMGYMSHDERYSRFFSLLNLFVAFMLVLVLGASFPLMFIGWEGVGLCSYLLIGFWYEDVNNAAAGTKAFIVNRIGDFGFLAAMFVLFAATGTLTYAGVFAKAGMLSETVLLVVTLLLFLGATGKSAQIPLFVWLPDAMAGPTPVSALIHAATMVTAGVYMVARCHVLFTATPATQMVVAGIGALTALMAAIIAMTQFDLKKILAYSTVSQLGYMFIGVGTGAYAAGVFHLFTHAFFKACLFLGAGAVMHALANNIDVRKMGGLKRYMPYTRWTYLVAVLAIAGIFPFAGFFSKDDILAAAFDRGGFYTGIWAVGLLTAFLTALYMTRSYLLTFEGNERVDWPALKSAAEHGGHGHGAESHEEHQEPVAEYEKHGLIHELPGMNFVLAALALGSLLVGFLFGISSLSPNTLANLNFEKWLEPALGAWWPHAAEHAGHTTHGAHHGPLSHVALAGISLVVAALGIVTAFVLERSGRLEKCGLPLVLYNLSRGMFFVDEIYQALIIDPGKRIGAWLWQVFDTLVVDGAVNGTASTVRAIGGGLRLWTSGYVRSYAFSVLLGVVLIVGWLIIQSITQASALPVLPTGGAG
jgi:NADH-quinone oxidoreductase subunit L